MQSLRFLAPFSILSTLFSPLVAATPAEIEKLNQGLEKSGNLKPRIIKLSAKEEAAILKDTTVPEGFQKTLFAPWQTANYPVYIAASPSGDIYVSSDGNGSLGRESGRGRVLRLRDTDQDGRADQVTEFIPDIDSPRGLIWDHDRLYLLHPPHISVFFDRDGDGIAEDSKRLISDIAFGFKDRPADHTTNGLEMGIDGWIYVAAGDFGFMKATGTDGRALSHRAGGVVRFRPDGTGLELFSTGTRNILATPISPTLDIFARDNTNDGGGWDIRLHHFTGLSDHGYPRLYKNFEKETIAPLADYGGGSGCGGVYLSEPGFPDEWNHAPITVDWGRAGSYRHQLEPHGATFKETKSPQRFIKMTRPTDTAVDGMSSIYQAAWKGPATFGWAGVNQGYIVKVTPKNYFPEPLPDFEKMTDQKLVAALNSPSHIRRLAAQREALKRPQRESLQRALLAHVRNEKNSLNSRVASLFSIAQKYPELPKEEWGFENLNEILPYLLRALADQPSTHKADFSALLKTSFETINPNTIREAIFSCTKLELSNLAPEIASCLDSKWDHISKDPVIRHTAYRALAKMSAHEAAFSQIDSDDIDTRKAAAWALMRMHKKEVIDGLLSRLKTQQDFSKRRPLISTLARLYHIEAEWKGNSWGTRPDTRGPYYELATWHQSERILKSLKSLLDQASPEEAAFIVTKLNKNRIQDNAALKRIIELANQDPELIPDAIAQIAASDNPPTSALPLVLRGAMNPSTPAAGLSNAVKILISCDHPSALSGSIQALITLERLKGADTQFRPAREAFFQAPQLENHHHSLEELVTQKTGTSKSRWAAMAVLELASRKKGSPESREMSLKAIEKAWENTTHKITYLNAARDSRNTIINDLVEAATEDPDPKIAIAAKDAARKLRIKLPKSDNVIIAQIKAVPNELRFDQTRIDIRVGQKIHLTLSNPDKLAHNLVIVQPGSEKSVAKAAVALGAQGFEKGWLPEHEEIVAATKMLNENEDDTIEITFNTRGKYPYICSFPGHDGTMAGVIVVK